MSIVASQDINELGPHESAPVPFHWNLAWTLLPRVPYAILLLLLVTKRNRAERAWTVLIPLAVVHTAVVLPLTLETLIELPNLADDVGAVATAVAIVYALSYVFEEWSRVKIAIVISAVMALVVWLASTAVPESAEKTLLAAMAVSILLSAVAAAVCCYRNYTSKKYALWFLAWLFPALLFIFWLLIKRILPPTGMTVNEVMLIMPQLAEVALVITLALYLIAVPFLALFLWHKTYRNRLCKMFRLTGITGDS